MALTTHSEIYSGWSWAPNWDYCLAGLMVPLRWKGSPKALMLASQYLMAIRLAGCLGEKKAETKDQKTVG